MANSYPIYIKNISADNSNLVVKWTLVLLVLNWISHWLFLDEMAIANMFLYGLGIVGFLLGFLKSTEPKVILKIDLKGLYYCHRWGSLFCPWSNVQRMDIPRVTGLGPSYEFDFIGVKFKDEEDRIRSSKGLAEKQPRRKKVVEVHGMEELRIRRSLRIRVSIP